MPAPAPFSSPHNNQQYPALYLYPLNDSFVPKHILLQNNQHVKIGRQTNVKTVPAERNGYFDSKVLSRQHAEVWEESGKIFIKDVKSSNGTFINSERLSPEGLESEPYELKTDDIVEFGIDIVGEDNKTIIHHKVAARVVCVLTEQDLQAALRAEQLQSSSSLSAPHAGPSSISSSSASVTGAPRRPNLMQQQGISGMGGMGGSMRPPGKSGLTFEHILSRLQGELQKSRETGAELHSLSTAMGDIHDTLGGALPANLPQYPAILPPIRPPQPPQSTQPDNHSSPAASEAAPLATLGELQNQLHETQSSLASHIDKIRTLEGVLAEHEAMKLEIGALREMMEERKREMEIELGHGTSRHHSHGHDNDQEDLDDDARSIHTIIPHELERVVEEDEEQLRAEEEEEEDRRRRREELGRPRTPEPTGLGLNEDDYEMHHRVHGHDHEHASERRSPSPPSDVQESTVIDELSRRLAVLSERIESVLETSSHLQAEHAEARSAISDLVSKVSALEALVQATQGQMQAQQIALKEVVQQQRSAPIREHDQRELLTATLEDWKKAVEGQWSVVREEWSQERERLSRAREEWETRVKAVESGLGTAVGKVDAGVATLAAIQAQVQQQQQQQQEQQLQQQHQHKAVGNGDAIHGLVTPPSPRSLSSDSTSSRTRHRKRRSSLSRGRSRSLPHTHTNGKSARGGDGELELLGMALGDEEDDVACAHGQDSEAIIPGGFTGPIKSRAFSPPLRLLDALKMNEQSSKMAMGMSMSAEEAARTLATPDPSVQMSASESMTDSKSDQSISSSADEVSGLSLSTAVGVLVLSVAAAAVLWRVKPE